MLERYGLGCMDITSETPQINQDSVIIIGQQQQGRENLSSHQMLNISIESLIHCTSCLWLPSTLLFLMQVLNGKSKMAFRRASQPDSNLFQLRATEMKDTIIGFDVNMQRRAQLQTLTVIDMFIQICRFVHCTVHIVWKISRIVETRTQFEIETKYKSQPCVQWIQHNRNDLSAIRALIIRASSPVLEALLGLKCPSLVRRER